MAKKIDLWGGTSGAVTAAILAVVFDKLFPLDRLTEQLPSLWRIFLGFLFVLSVFLIQHYYAILGGADEPHNSEDREDYDRLRQSLLNGGTPKIVYNRWLTRILEMVDGFFGDAGRKDSSWIARILHLETDGPRWTAIAFDKCLLLALLYPIFLIYVMWSFIGHVGVAERALDLPFTGFYWEIRVVVAIWTILCAYVIYRLVLSDKFISVLAWFVMFSAVLYVDRYIEGFIAGYIEGYSRVRGVAVAEAFVGLTFLRVPIAIGGGLAIGFRKGRSGAIAVASTLTIAVASAFVFGRLRGYSGYAVGATISAFGYVLMFLALTREKFTKLELAKPKRRWRFATFGYFAIMCIACFAVPYAFAQLDNWHLVGSLVLFCGLLTLVNAPFDWLALGFTRALLRLGLSRGDWWPFIYALIDVLVATVSVVVLAFAMVIAAQAFDDIAVLRAGPNARILPLGPLFQGLESAPTEYEYWWIWFLLFSSMIPSIFNVSVAAAALLRGLPPINSWILDCLPTGRAVRKRDRFKVALALTAQLVGGLALTGAAVYVAWLYFIPVGLLGLGTLTRDLAAILAQYNAPARVFMWFLGAR